MFSRWDRKILFALAPLVLLHQCITSSLHCSARQPTSSPQVKVHLKHLHLVKSVQPRMPRVQSKFEAMNKRPGLSWAASTESQANLPYGKILVQGSTKPLPDCCSVFCKPFLACIFVFCTILICTLFALPHCLLSGYSKHTTLSFLGSIIQVSHELRLGPPLFKTIDLWGEHI